MTESGQRYQDEPCEGRIVVGVSGSLVVGAGSGGRLRRGLRRSVTAYCVKHAGCPVLAVPRPVLQRELGALHRRNAWHLPGRPVPRR